MRLRTLPVSVAGVLAGTACAIMAGGFRWLPALICLIFALLAQIVSNFANEYYDFRNGLDRKGREGFRRGVTEGDITPDAMKKATWGLLLLTCLVGCSLIYWGGWWMLPIGALIALFALAYSAGPWPLSHHGMGDLAVIIFFGIVPVTLTCYLQTGNFDNLSCSLPVGVAIGMLAADVLIVNNYRDMEDDRAVGKHTTVVIFGRKVMGFIYILFPVLALGMIAGAAGRYLPPLWGGVWSLCGVAYIPIWNRLREQRGAALNRVLAMTARMMLIVCVLLTVAAATAHL